MKLPFSSVEYRRRLANTKARMEEAGIDVLFASDPANMNYLTGYDGWSFYVHQMVVVAQDEPEPLWIGRPMDANGARVTTWLHHDSIYDYPDHFVQSTEHHPMDLVADIARERRWARKRIGVEMDAYYFTGACIERLRAKLPRVRFKDATGLVNWVRIVKSRRELEYISQAARIAEKVMRTGIDHVRPGRRQCDAAAEIWRTGVRGTREFGGDYPSLPPMLPTGAGISAPHLTWTDEKFRKGQGTVLELAGVRLHYHCPMARTVFPGDTAEANGRLRQGGGRGPGDGACRHEAGRHRARSGGGVAPGHLAPRHRQGVADRLLHRTQLSARLGGAHHQPASG